MGNSITNVSAEIIINKIDRLIKGGESIKHKELGRNHMLTIDRITASTTGENIFQDCISPDFKPVYTVHAALIEISLTQEESGRVFAHMAAIYKADQEASDAKKAEEALSYLNS